MHRVVGVAHLDIKPENILIDGNGIARFGDFGVSKFVKKKKDWISDLKGTPMYQPPETWLSQKFRAFQVDIWSLGITLFYFQSGKLPFDANDTNELRKLAEAAQPSYPDSMSPGLKNLLSRCLTADPAKRITLEEMVEDPWLTSFSEDPLPNLDLHSIELSDEDISKAISRIKLEANMFAVANIGRKMSRFRRAKTKKSTFPKSPPKILKTQTQAFGDIVQSPSEVKNEPSEF